jgi:hypothetical protein
MTASALEPEADFLCLFRRRLGKDSAAFAESKGKSIKGGNDNETCQNGGGDRI